MIILGIADSHESHACIVKNGVLISAISEERITREKSDIGYPKNSINQVIKNTKISPKDIDLVCFAGENPSSIFQALYKNTSRMSVQDHIKLQHNYWWPILFEGKQKNLINQFESFLGLVPKVKKDPYYRYYTEAKKKYSHDVFHPDLLKFGNDLRKKTVMKHLGILENKIQFFRHEDCHKVYGFHSSVNQTKEALIFTIEGLGDDSSATVSKINHKNIKEYWSSREVNLGRLYKFVTLLLGMLPSQHEYKVMGLAPYGTEYHGKRSLKIFRSLAYVKGTKILATNKYKDLYFSLKNTLEGERFDGIAWALQKFTEEILCKWIKNNIKQHSIDHIILSGGVAQNIKAIKSIADMKEVKSIWAGPISGDGSLGIGAAWMGCRQNKNNVNGLNTVYLGSSYDKLSINKAINKYNLKDKFSLDYKITNKKIADLIYKGKIIARFSGKMEFGQRALGNRSIIADPRTIKSVEKINQKVKYRDFWMPFTPSILYEDCKYILKNNKNIYSPFMTMAFNVNKKYIDLLQGVIHPSDKTIRPQMLKKEDNPNYYDLISSFKDISGLGVLLNTSFNLHGDAIVETPGQAIETFLKSSIDILLFDHVCILRK